MSKHIIREDIAKNIEELLYLPKAKNFRKSVAYRLAGKIQDAIIETILESGDLKIERFGIFRIKTYPERKRIKNHIPYFNCKDYPRTIEDYPASRRVIFKPSKVLKRLVNGRTK